MVVRRIMVEIDTSDDDLDIEEYVDAIEDVCREVESRATVAGETKISVGASYNE